VPSNPSLRGLRLQQLRRLDNCKWTSLALPLSLILGKNIYLKSNSNSNRPQQMTLPRLPSQLEMDIHDFTREEIAEKKFYLLNDNGQVDWFLTTGGGLEIQYLNMLGAHSSYWVSADFIRLIVVEVGRTPGRNHALPNMRAAKIGVRVSRTSE
jgi:hypothetical protein